MKKSLIGSFFLFAVMTLTAQKPLPDSTMKEFTRLTCECATLMKVDEGSLKNGFSNLSTCVNTTTGVYIQKGWIKNEWMDDLLP